MILSFIHKPNRQRKNGQGYPQRPPKEPIFAEPTQIDQDYSQPVKSVQQEKQEQKNIDGGIEMHFFGGTEEIRQVRDFAASSPARVNFHGNQKEQTNRANPLHQP